MSRLIALVVIGLALASCSGGISGGIIGDYAPQWAGGFPKDLPPRQGTVEYDAWRKKKEAEADRDKSKDPPRQRPTLPGSRGCPNRAGQDSGPEKKTCAATPSGGVPHGRAGVPG